MRRYISAIVALLGTVIVATSAYSDDMRGSASSYFKDFAMRPYEGPNGGSILPVFSGDVFAVVSGASRSQFDVVSFYSENISKITGVKINPAKDKSKGNLFFIFSDDLLKTLREDRSGIFKKMHGGKKYYDNAVKDLDKDKSKSRKCVYVIEKSTTGLSGGFVLVNSSMSIFGVHRCISNSYLGLFGFRKNIDSSIKSVLSDESIFTLSEYDLRALRLMYESGEPKVNYQEILHR